MSAILMYGHDESAAMGTAGQRDDSCPFNNCSDFAVLVLHHGIEHLFSIKLCKNCLLIAHHHHPAMPVGKGCAIKGSRIAVRKMDYYRHLVTLPSFALSFNGYAATYDCGTPARTRLPTAVRRRPAGWGRRGLRPPTKFSRESAAARTASSTPSGAAPSLRVRDLLCASRSSTCTPVGR